MFFIGRPTTLLPELVFNDETRCVNLTNVFNHTESIQKLQAKRTMFKTSYIGVAWENSFPRWFKKQSKGCFFFYIMFFVVFHVINNELL